MQVSFRLIFIGNHFIILGASSATIEAEERKLQELQAAVFQDFRQDILNRLKRQSVKATALKDKLGLGYKPAHIRSKSTSAAAPVVVKKKDFRDSRRLASHRYEVLRRVLYSHLGMSLDLNEVIVAKFWNRLHALQCLIK